MTKLSFRLSEFSSRDSGALSLPLSSPIEAVATTLSFDGVLKQILEDQKIGVLPMGKCVDKSKKKEKQQKERAIRLQISEDSRVKQACHDKWRDSLNPVVGDLGFDRLEVGFEDHEDEQQHENDEQQHEQDENDEQQHEQDENDEQQHENDEQQHEQHENDEQQHERDQQQHEDDQRDHQREDDQQDQQDIPDEADLLLGGPAPPGAARPGPAPHL